MRIYCWCVGFEYLGPEMVSVDPASFPSWRLVWGLCLLYLSNSTISSLDTNAIGIHGAWEVSDVALSDGPVLPPTDPRTHGRVHTQLHQRAGCACADPVPRNVAHACRGPRKSGRDACPVAGRASGTPAMARGAVSADPRGSCHQPRRYHVSPATRGSAGLFPQEIRPALQLGPLCFSLLLNLLLISLLYYTHAPQLLHVSPPMRVFSHTQDDPCCTVAGSMAAESVSVTIVSGR